VHCTADTGAHQEGDRRAWSDGNASGEIHGRPLLCGFRGEKDIYRKEMHALAKRYSDDLLFTIIDINQHPLMPSLAGLHAGGGISVENLRTGELFPYLDDISATELEGFIIGLIKGAVALWDGLRPSDVSHDEL